MQLGREIDGLGEGEIPTCYSEIGKVWGLR